MNKDRKISPEDKALFRKSVGKVNLHRHDKVELRRPHPAPAPRHRLRDEHHMMVDMLSDEFDPHDSLVEEMQFSRPGVQNSVLRKLRQGKIAIGAELDLHGKTIAEARASVARFLAECQAVNIRAVRIVHGKGYGSHLNKPVLKVKLNSWLQQRDEVLAFCPAQRMDGGTGAVYVLLRGNRGRE